jgi:signal transduction histidine kinase
MLGMAAILLALVTAFFWLYLGPVMNASINDIAHEYMHSVASSAPNFEQAKEIGARLNVETRYEGPDAKWATDADLPSIADARRLGRESLSRRHYYLATAPNGGSYLFAWNAPRRTHAAHLVVPAVVLCLIGSVVFVGYGMLRRQLLPLRLLSDGVAQLSEGHLDVVVPRHSADEFGVLTDAFNRMVGRVRDMIRARDRLLLDVSHELRSPLTRLKVVAELVGDAELKNRMDANLAQMDIMIGELLELERLRDGSGITTTRQNLATVLEDVAEGFHDRAPSTVVAPMADIPVDIDVDQIRTVFRNLLENAVKYSLPDSSPVEVSAAQEGDKVVIRVTDDGVGIPEDDKANLFEPFFRVDRSRSKKTGGYGLGLSISKRIIEAHGGTIAVENNATRGASIIVTLPKAPRGA